MELALLWLVMAVICAIVAHSKGKSPIGYFFGGLLLWPIALVLAIVAKKESESAPGGVRPSPANTKTPAAPARESRPMSERELDRLAQLRREGLTGNQARNVVLTERRKAAALDRDGKKEHAGVDDSIAAVYAGTSDPIADVYSGNVEPTR